MCCIKRKKKNTILYKVEALSKQRAHTIKGNAHTPTQTQTHTHAVSLFFSFFSILNGDEDTHSLLVAGVSARVHAEQLDAVRAPVEADSRVEDQGPDVGDEEIFRLVFLHILELQLRKLLFTQKEKETLLGCTGDEKEK